jgi:hypothetical protein
VASSVTKVPNGNGRLSRGTPVKRAIPTVIGDRAEQLGRHEYGGRRRSTEPKQDASAAASADRRMVARVRMIPRALARRCRRVRHAHDARRMLVLALQTR